MTQSAQDVAQLVVGDPQAVLTVGSTFTIEATQVRYNPFDFPSYEEANAEVSRFAGDLAAEFALRGLQTVTEDTAFSVDLDQLAPDILASIRFRVVGITEAATTQDPETKQAGVALWLGIAAVVAVVAAVAWEVDQVSYRRYKQDLVASGLTGFVLAVVEDVTDAALPIAASLVAIYFLSR